MSNQYSSIQKSTRKIQEYYLKKYGVIIDESDVNFLNDILREIMMKGYTMGEKVARGIDPYKKGDN